MHHRYSDSVQFLYALGNEIKTAKLGLERIAEVLDALGRPQDRTRFVHVAGTNGKGSSCAMIASALKCAGRRTGLFTSPHLSEPTERIQIDGQPISAERFAAAFERVHAVVEQLLLGDRLHYNFDGHCHGAAGLRRRSGGYRCARSRAGRRLDATNVVTPELCVITPIDFDHEASDAAWSHRGREGGIPRPASRVFAAAQ